MAHQLVSLPSFMKLGFHNRYSELKGKSMKNVILLLVMQVLQYQQILLTLFNILAWICALPG